MAQPSEYGYKYVPPYSQPVNAQTVYGTDETPMYRPKPIKPVTERLIEKRPAGGYQTIPDYMADVYRFAREAAVEEGLDPSTPEAQAKINETVTMARQHATDFVHPVNPKEFVKVSPGEKLIHPVSGKEIASGGEKIPDSINTRNIEEGMGWQQANQMTTEAVDALGIPRESPEWVNRYHEMYRGNVDAAVPSMRDAAKAKKAQAEKMDAPKNLQQTSLIDEEGSPLVFDPQTNTHYKAGVPIDRAAPKGKIFDTAQGATPSTAKPVGSPKRQRVLPAEASAKISQFDSLDNQLNDIEGLYDPSFVGLADAKLGTARQATGLMASEREGEFRSLLSGLQNQLVYLRSGAQINENEFKRLMKELPQLNTSETDFKARLKAFRKSFQVIKDAKIKGYQDAGYTLNNGASSTRVSTRQEFDALPSGATYIGKDGKTYRKP